MRKLIALTLVVTTFLTLGCSVDKVIAGLRVADSVCLAAKGILAPVNPQLAVVLGQVSTDLEVTVKTYQDYEAAAPGDKPSKSALLLATVTGIQTNLTDLLAAVHVKNPQLVVYVSTAVAIINSALQVLKTKLPNTSARGLSVTPDLPVIDGAKSPTDLKNAWNNTVKKAYPSAVVK